MRRIYCPTSFDERNHENWMTMYEDSDTRVNYESFWASI